MFDGGLTKFVDFIFAYISGHQKPAPNRIRYKVCGLE